MVEHVFVARVELSDDDVVELARRVDPDVSERLWAGIDMNVRVLGLSIRDVKRCCARSRSGRTSWRSSAACSSWSTSGASGKGFDPRLVAYLD
jgi:hypothetical protein